MSIYGYCRISTPKQSIDRQIRNILAAYPEAHIYQESYSGRKISRPEFDKLLKRVRSGDTIVFDSVSRMSRTAAEGVDLYMQLFEQGVKLVFLKERYIDTDTYRQALGNKLDLTGGDVDPILNGLNEFFRLLARKQIQLAFDQAQKEVDDLRQRTKEGIETARLNSRQIGQKKGSKLDVKKSAPAKKVILAHSKAFGGTLNDTECMKLAGISRNTYYKYKAELLQGQIGT